MKYRKNQHVTAKTPVGTETGTIVREVEVYYTVKLDSGLAFRVKESDIKPLTEGGTK